MNSTAFRATTLLRLHPTRHNRSTTLCLHPRIQCRRAQRLAHSGGPTPSGKLPLRPVLAALDAASSSPDAGSPEGGQPELKGVWKAVRLGTVVCLLAGACAALGYGVSTSALLATSGVSQKGAKTPGLNIPHLGPQESQIRLRT